MNNDDPVFYMTVSANGFLPSQHTAYKNKTEMLNQFWSTFTMSTMLLQPSLADCNNITADLHWTTTQTTMYK